MKKIRFLVLQLFISAIMIVLGLLINSSKSIDTSGAALVVLVIPGADILLSSLIEFIKLKQWWIYSIIYFVLALIADLLIIILCKVPMQGSGYGIVFASIVLTTLICSLFHLIYANIKKPGRTR